MNNQEEGRLLTKRTVGQIRTCIVDGEVPESHDGSSKHTQNACFALPKDKQIDHP